jgi:hypothetical protein
MLSSSAFLRQKTHVPKPHYTGNNTYFLEKPVSCEKTYRKSNSIATREDELREWIPTAVATKSTARHDGSFRVYLEDGRQT